MNTHNITFYNVTVTGAVLMLLGGLGLFSTLRRLNNSDSPLWGAAGTVLFFMLLAGGGALLIYGLHS